MTCGVAAMMGGGGGANNVAGTPSKSLSFIAGNSQYLSMSQANFGAWNRFKFAISTWVNISNFAASNQSIFSQNTIDLVFVLQIDTLNRIDFATSTNNTSYNARQVTSSTALINPGIWTHVLVWYDSANSTAGDRMRMWVNGTEITSFNTDTNPSAPVTNVNNSGSAPLNISRYGTGSDDFFGGLKYQQAFFSGTLPDISTVYNSGHPMNISGLAGLQSVLDCASGVVTHDGILGTAWTNNNTVTYSSNIPT